jgi:hypothetical protein
VPTIVRAVQTSDYHPAQWDAWTATGQYLYPRYRSGIGTADAYDSPDWETWTRIPDGGIARFEEPNTYAEITLEEFCQRAGLTLAPDCDDTSWEHGDDAARWQPA